MKTVEELSLATAQHLTKQGARSVVPAGTDRSQYCAYRGSRGLMCAVGCLIKDEHYSPSLESLPSDDLAVRTAVESSLGQKLSDEHIWLLGCWQAYHDNGEYESWLEGFGSAISPEKKHEMLMEYYDRRGVEGLPRYA